MKENNQDLEINNTFVVKSVYEYTDFINYHDVEFIQNLYTAFLNRKADDAGLNYYLSLLRSGERTKTEIISLFRSSKEAQVRDIKLLGHKKRLFITKIKSLPIISYLVKTAEFLLFVPKYIKRLNQLESNLFFTNSTLQTDISTLKQNSQIKMLELETSLDSHIQTSQTKMVELETSLDSHIQTLKQDSKELSFLLEDKLHVFESCLDDKADIQDTTALYETLTKEKDTLLSYVNKVDRFIQDAKQRLPKEFTNDELKQITSLPNTKFDDIYKSFEDNFRGTKQEIKDRLKIYLPFLENISLHKEEISILDINRGQEEWLELLKENGYSAKGSNFKEVLSYLKSLPQNSLSLISGFHIIEHLNSFDDVLTLLSESHRVLKPKGMIIFETPNARNILVGASDFYLDPSHQKPLHPMTMKFFAQKSGFRDAQSLVIKDGKFSDIDEIDFYYIDDYVYTGRDYAIVGSKN